MVETNSSELLLQHVTTRGNVQAFCHRDTMKCGGFGVYNIRQNIEFERRADIERRYPSISFNGAAMDRDMYEIRKLQQQLVQPGNNRH